MAIAQRSGRPRLARQLAAGRLATGPVREVVERTVTELLIPVDAHGWTTALTELTRQLSDPCSKTSREHWQHRRILAALAEATAAMAAPTPAVCGARLGVEVSRRRSSVRDLVCLCARSLAAASPRFH